MKKKILIFLLVTFSFANAQVNVNENFETAFPTGWTTSGQTQGFTRISTSSACSGSFALSVTPTPSNSFAQVITDSYTSDGNAITVSFQYNRGIGAIAGNVYLYYDINNAGTWPQIATSNNLGPGCNTLFGGIPSGTVPAGSTVRFRMQINSTSSTSVFFDDFRAVQQPFVSEHTFNGTFSNTDNLYSFGAANTSFVTDRNGNASSAMQINANVSGSQTVIQLLPKGNGSRSFSVWYKSTANNADVFTYGTTGTNATFGTYIGNTGNIAFSSYSGAYDFGGNYAINTWRHMVITYDGTNVRMYSNGSILGTPQAFALATGNNSAFRLGSNQSTLTVDDLKMYDRALTANEIENLYNYNNLIAPVPVAPVISNISAAPFTNGANINYTINANNAPTTTVIKYGTNSGNLDNQIAGFSSSGTTITPGSIIIPNLSTSTQYFYQIEASNSVSTVTSTVGSFTTTTAVTPVAEYNFNTTLSNVAGNSPFSTNSSWTYVADRSGNASSALRIGGSGSSATIAGLPTGISTRSVAIWYKVFDNSNNNGLFVYGQSGGESAYGVSFNNSNTWYNFAWNTNTSFTNPSNDGTWHHLVTTYDASRTSRVYIDGVLKVTAEQYGWNTAVNNNEFWLGSQFSPSSGVFDGTVDDLKIFNVALTDAQVLSLFNTPSLSSPSFNQNNLEVSLYPNPANNMLNIEMTNEVKSIEIYNIQGQKVQSATQKQINVSDLASGMYMIKIQDAENAIATKKFLKQ